MANGNGGIAILLLHHELGHRLTNDVGATQNDALLTTGLDIVTLQQRDDSQRGSRDEAGQADGHATYVDGMESIDILTIVDSLDDLLLVNVLGLGQLNDETIDIAIAIQVIHTCQKLSLSDILLKANER